MAREHSSDSFDGDLPLISVVVPVYNVKNTLEDCLSSIWSQTYSNLEIILIDDGSMDGSGELCDQLALQKSNTRVIHQKNRGLSGARNTGIKNAKGQFLTFVDSDDWLASDAIMSLYNALKLHRTKIAIGQIMTTSDKPTASHFLSKNAHIANQVPNSGQHVQLLSQIEALTRMLLEKEILFSACGKLYARELFDKIKFPEGKLYEDVGTTYRTFLLCDQIAVLDNIVYYYYQNSSSIIHQAFYPAKLDLITLTDQMCDELTEKIINVSYAEYISDRKLITPEQSSPRRTDVCTTVESGSSDVGFSSPQSPPVVQELSPGRCSKTSTSEPIVLSASEFEQAKSRLSDAIRKRRVHARLSILRQLVFAEPVDSKQAAHFQSLQADLVLYVKQHRDDILKNPLATARDKLAVYALLLGLPVFKLAWTVYRH